MDAPPLNQLLTGGFSGSKERFFRDSQKLLKENLGQIRVPPDDMTLGHQAALTVLGFLVVFWDFDRR